MESKKKKFIELYNNNYHLVVASSLFVVIGVIAIMWTLYDQSVANRFDINNISGLEDVDYTAVYYNDVEEPYITIESEGLEDIHLVTIQYALYKNSQDKVPVYWVSSDNDFIPDNSFHQSEVYKKSIMIDNGLHEVTGFEHLYVSESDPNAVSDWDITSGEFKGGAFLVEGELAEDTNSMEKYSQLRALTEMIRSINKDNEKLDDVPLLLDFESGDDKFLYHTDFEDTLGKSSLYRSKKIEP